MEIFIWSIFWFIFFLTNTYIVLKDVREKIIPNVCIILLLVLGIIYLIYNSFFSPINSEIFLYALGNIFLSFIISFLLFHINIWGAGDAKYAIALSIFIFSLNFFTFLGNLSLLILSFLSVNYLYFYISHSIKKSSLGRNILFDIKSKIIHFVTNTTEKKIILSFLLFALMFISLRMYRIYALGILINTRISLLTITLGIIFILLIGVLLSFLYKKYFQKGPYIYYIFIGSFILIFMFFLGYEFSQDKQKVLHLLYQICTSYLIIFLLIKVFIYSIKVYTGQDYYVKNIGKLEMGDIIERSDFNKKVLPMMLNKKKILSYYNIPTYGNITLDNELKNNITSLLRAINKNNIRLFGGNSLIQDIKCIKTFALAPYILGAFIVSFFFQDRILKELFSFVYSLFI